MERRIYSGDEGISRCGGAGAAAASETFEFGGAEGDQALPVSVYPDAWSLGES